MDGIVYLLKRMLSSVYASDLVVRMVFHRLKEVSPKRDAANGIVREEYYGIPVRI